MKKIFIMAGEASGDFLGAEFMRCVRNVLGRENVRFSGIGGAKMMSEGLENSIFEMSELSIMGISEIFLKFFKLKALIRRTIDAIREFDPDLVVGVDSQEFNFQVFKGIRGCRAKKLQYVAPSVWAWRPWRARKLAKNVDYLFTLFDFEVDYFTKYGLKTFCVGHPIVQNIDLHESSADSFRKNFDISQGDIVVALLPGSRHSEIRHHAETLASYANELALRHPNVKIFLPVTKDSKEYLQNYLKFFRNSPLLLQDAREKYALFKAAKFALAASGTAILELGMSGTPAAVFYKVGGFSAFIAKILLKVKHVNLVNIISRQEVYREFLQKSFNVRDLLEFSEKFFDDNSDYLKNMSRQLQNFQHLMIKSYGNIDDFEDMQEKSDCEIGKISDSNDMQKIENTTHSCTNPSQYQPKNSALFKAIQAILKDL